jgi:hypothetical protein
MLPALASSRELTGHANLLTNGVVNAAVLHDIAEAVLRSTSMPVSIDKSVTPQSFIAMHSGTNLRLEYLGLLYAVAGRAFIYECGESRLQHPFVRSMFRCCGLCLDLSRELSPINDVRVWLATERLLFITFVYGDTSEKPRLPRIHCICADIDHR